MEHLSKRLIKGYELGERVGAGGFGAVYRAYQPTIHREVAIKVILPQYANEPDFIRRFEVEAQLIARLEHPHIVPLYDYWRDPDGAYLVMRWLPNNVRASIQRGPWSAFKTARLLEQVAGALTVAHREGVIHRDIKPDNILLDEDDNAYLADFGIAKDLSLQDATSEASLVGSPAYLTPEQIKGDPVTARSDIYSLGLVLYEILVGNKPYAEASTLAELISKHLHDPMPPLPVRQNDLPAALNEVLQTATAKDPNQRYPTALRFAGAFQAALPNIRRTATQPLVTPLTERELEILRLMVDGLTNPAIAQKLVISAGTVKWYINQIYSKLDVHSRFQAVQRAHQLNLISVNSAPVTVRDTGVTLAVSTTTTAQTLALPELVNPYKGLRAFQEADAANFFGRASLTEQLLARLSERGEDSRFLVLVGPSGSGKSSVMRAGVIPALRKGALPNSAGWFITDMLPGTHPFEELEAALLRVSVSPLPNLIGELTTDRRGLVRAAKRILPADSDVELLLLIDQFEELFNLLPDEGVRTHFIDNLLSAVTDPRSRIRILLTLRADFYDRPLLYPRLAEMVSSHTEVIVPLTANEIERAITGPAQRIGLELETGLVTTIVNEVGEQPGALPLLQYALTELFERRDGRKLTLAAYRDSGGVSGALARRADESYNQLEDEQQALAQQIFLRLVTLGEGVEDTRRRVLQTELESLSPDSRVIDELLALFSQYRLLTLDRDPLTHQPTVEVAHEALIRTWTRLRGWLNDSREELQVHRRLAQAVVEWQLSSRDTSFLATGTRLTQFEFLVSSANLQLNLPEITYIQASVDDRDARQQRDDARKEHELTLQRHATNRLRYLVAVLVLFLLVSVGLSLSSINNATLANNNAHLADQNAATSAANFAHADALRLAAQAINILQANGDPQLGALLSIRSLDTEYSPQGDAALQQAATYDYPVKTFRGSGTLINSVGFSPDGKVFFSAGDTLDLWDAHTGAALHQLFSVPSPHGNAASGVILKAAYSDDGHYILSGGNDSTARLWDVVAARPAQIFSTYGSGITAVAISPDDNTILTGIGDGAVRLWDIKSGSNTQLFGHSYAVQSVAYSPDGKYVVTGSTDNTARLWDTQTGTEIRRFVGHIAGITTVAFSPNGKYVLTGSDDATARLWDTQTGTEIRRFVGHIAGITTAAFSPDGQYVFTGSDDRTARMWSVQSGVELRRFTGYTGSVVSLSVSPDGNTLVTASANTITLWRVSGFANLPTLAGHAGSIFTAAFSPDGSHLVTGGKDKTVRVWDIQTHQQTTQFMTDNALVSLAVGPDSESIFLIDDQASGQRGAGSSIGYLWNSRTALETDQRAITGRIYAVAYSPDGKYLMEGDDNDVANVWDVRTQSIVCTFHHDSIVGVVAFSADGNSALTRGRNGTVSLWNVSTCGKIRDITDPTPISSQISPAGESVALSLSGKYVLTGNPDGSVRLWDAATGTALRAFTGHTDAVNSVAFSPDGKLIITGSADQTARLWDSQTGHLLRIFVNAAGVNVVAFSPDGRSVLVATDDGLARVWDIDYQVSVQLLCRHLTRDFTDVERAQYGITDIKPTCPQAVNQITPTVTPLTTSLHLATVAENLLEGSTGDRQLALLLGIRAVKLSSAPFPRTVLETAVSAPQVLNHPSSVTGVAISSDGRYVVSASGKVAYLWDAHSGSTIRTFNGHTGTINAVAFSPDGKAILTGSDDLTARLWDAQTGSELRQFKGHTSSILSVAFSPDGKTILTGSGGLSFSGDDDTTARLWDVATGNQLKIFSHKDWVYVVKFSPDGKFILTSSQDKVVQLWDIQNGQVVQSFGDSVRQANGWSAAFSPDGKTILTVTWDGAAVLWDVGSGKYLQQWTLPNDQINAAIFSPDGKSILVSEVTSNNAALLDDTTGKLLATFAAHSDMISGLAISPDGKFVATSSKDHTVRLWSTDNRDLVTKACALLTRDFTDAERATYGIADTMPTCP